MEKIKISQKELKQLLENEATVDQTLNDFFELDLSEAFTVSYRLKDHVEIITDKGDPVDKNLVKDLFKRVWIPSWNKAADKNRYKKYKKVLDTAPDRIKIVAEGDSWFLLPVPNIDDILDHLSKYYAVRSIGAGGAELRNMFSNPRYLEVIIEEDPQFFILSGGGNDLLGKQFNNFLEFNVDRKEPGTEPERFLKRQFFKEIENLGNIYSTLIRKVLKVKPDIQILIHGYDYIVPRNKPNIGYVGQYLIRKEIKNQKDKKALMKLMIDAFNDTLSSVAEKYSNVTYLDLRNTDDPSKWYDEIHPTSSGFQDVSLKFHEVIDHLS